MYSYVYPLSPNDYASLAKGHPTVEGHPETVIFQPLYACLRTAACERLSPHRGYLSRNSWILVGFNTGGLGCVGLGCILCCVVLCYVVSCYVVVCCVKSGCQTRGLLHVWGNWEQENTKVPRGVIPGLLREFPGLLTPGCVMVLCCVVSCYVVTHSTPHHTTPQQNITQHNTKHKTTQDKTTHHNTKVDN